MSAARPEEPPPPSPAARRRARELEARTLIEIAHTLDSSVDECQRLTRSLTLLKTLLRCDRCSILFNDFDVVCSSHATLPVGDIA